VLDWIPGGVPDSFRSDFCHNNATRCLEEGNYQQAYILEKAALETAKGGVGAAFLVKQFSQICFALKRYDEAKHMLEDLVAQGYAADNSIHLGKIYQEEGRYREAIEAYRKGLDAIGLSDEDLDHPVFPIIVQEDFGSYTAFVGLGECLTECGAPDEAARMFRRAAKLKANSHLPFRGFAKLFLLDGDLANARIALDRALALFRKDPKTWLLLGNLLREKSEECSAFEAYRKAWDLDRSGVEVLASLFSTGSALGLWEDLRIMLEEFLSHRPGHLPALRFMARTCLAMGEAETARRWLDKAMLLDPTDDRTQRLLGDFPRENRRRGAG
jgi:tetratricopeptide (TPR) repeat protein